MFFPALIPSLTALCALALPLLHPHVPKAIVLHGAGGKTTLTWFTVPYNPEQVKKLPNGAQWHLGYAGLDVGMPLQVGEVRVAPAKYKLDTLRGGDGEFSALVLVPWDLYQASRGRNPDADKVAAIKQQLAAQHLEERIELPLAKHDAPAAEHLEFAVLARGFETVARFSAEPNGGAVFDLFADFGDLHRKVTLTEVFSKPEAGDKK